MLSSLEPWLCPYYHVADVVFKLLSTFGTCIKLQSARFARNSHLQQLLAEAKSLV